MFGAAGNEAVVVCADSDVYALGSNTNGCLGVGDLRSSLQARKVDALCKKGLCVFVFVCAGYTVHTSFLPCVIHRI